MNATNASTARQTVLQPRAPCTDSFVDLTGSSTAVDLPEANNVVDLTGCTNLRNAYPTDVCCVHKGKKGIISASDGDKNARKFEDDLATAEDNESANLNNQNNTLKLLDQIIFKLDRRTGYMDFMTYTVLKQTAKEYNATAYRPSSHLQRPPHIIPPPGRTVHQAILANAMAGLPSYPDPDLQVPALPTTVKGISTLTKAKLTAVEDYYGLSHEGKVAERRDRIKQCYGIRLHR